MTNVNINGLFVETKTMAEWQDHFFIDVIHPGGWIEAGIPGGDFPLTEATFIKLALASTITPTDSDLSFFKYVRKLEENGGIIV